MNTTNRGWSKERQLKFPESWKLVKEKLAVARLNLSPVNKGKTGLQKNKYKGKKLPWIGHSTPHTKESKEKDSASLRAYNDKIYNKSEHTEFETFKRDVRRGIIKRPDYCEACGVPTNNKSGMKHSICIDHDHKTGKVRGWLCNQCNRAVGMCYDNPETLRKLASYLDKFIGS